jgi:hypothetical protein
MKFSEHSELGPREGSFAAPALFASYALTCIFVRVSAHSTSEPAGL